MFADPSNNFPGPDPFASCSSWIPVEGGAIGWIPAIQRIPGGSKVIVSWVNRPELTVHNGCKSQRLINNSIHGSWKFGASYPVYYNRGDRNLSVKRLPPGFCCYHAGNHPYIIRAGFPDTTLYRQHRFLHSDLGIE